MAAMASLLKASSSLVVNRDLKWRNPPLLLRTTQISFPSSMIKNSSSSTSGLTTTTTIKCRSDFRVQCVMNSKNNKNCFKKEGFGKVMLKALEKPGVVVILGWLLLTKNPSIALRRNAIFFVWLVYDLCKTIWVISSQYSRLRNGQTIRFSVGSVFSLVMFFLYVFAEVFGFRFGTTLTWEKEEEEEEEGTKITIAQRIISYIVMFLFMFMVKCGITIAYIVTFLVMFMVMLFGSESWTLTPPPRWSSSSKEELQ